MSSKCFILGIIVVMHRIIRRGNQFIYFFNWLINLGSKFINKASLIDEK